jgi:murein DD-endopeptidase MepM/ murein hydrolase activator NlpD
MGATMKLRWTYRAYWGIHPGIDFYAPVGRPVFHVVNKGRVVFIGKNGGYGLTVKVRCEIPKNRRTEIGVMYNHLSRVSSAIAVGRLVTLGQVIGYSGGAKGDPNAGTSTGPHLHFAYWDTSLKGVGKEHFIDPKPYFAAGGVTL